MATTAANGAENPDQVFWVVVAPGSSRTTLLEPAETGLDVVADGLSMDALSSVLERRGAAAAEMPRETAGAVSRQDAPAVLHVPGVPRKHVASVLRGIDDHHCVVTTPVEASEERRAQWCSAWFDGATVHSIFFLPEPLAACFAVGELNGARVVDLGHTGCRVSYVSHGSVQRFFLSRSLAASRFPVDAAEDWDALACTDGSPLPPSLSRARQRYLQALFPMGAGAKGLPQLLERLPSRAMGKPVIVCGGGVGLAGPGLRGMLAAAVAQMEASTSDESTDDGSSSSSSDEPVLRSKILVSRDPAEARSLTALGASLFGAAGVEKVTVLRSQYDAVGPRVVLSKCPS